jgi:hypothetical protein
VQLVPDREDAARATYDRQPGVPEVAAEGQRRSFRSDWRELTRDAETDGGVARLVGVVRGLVYGLRELGPRLRDAVQQLGRIMWDMVTRPDLAFAQVRALIAGVFGRFPEAFGSIREAIAPPGRRFDQAATEVAVLLGYQAIVDALQHGLYGQAVGRGLFELVASYGPMSAGTVTAGDIRRVPRDGV